MLTFFLIALGVCLLVVSFALALARREYRRRGPHA